MQNLVPIGRFAQLSGLTVKALRLYDKLGLLSPAVIDLPSGYRYYSPDQVSVARRIRLLRSLDMPLSDIQALLKADDPEVVQSQLTRHRRRIAERIVDYQRALALLPTFEELYESSGKEQAVERESKAYRCSFCGKDNAEIERMIAGPQGVFICNECVDKCNELIAREEAKQA